MKLIAGLALTAALAACATRPEADTARIVGTWRLVSYEDRAEGQPALFPYGEHPKGQLMYDAAGNMAIQIMGMPHPKIASGSDTSATPAEKIALFDAYTAYFGKYRVDAERGVVITRVEGDIADVFIGGDEERPFRLVGDRLTLTPEWEDNGVRWKGVRVFERMN